MTALMRNIRCPECNGLLHGAEDYVTCDDCDGRWITVPFGRQRLKQDEVLRFTTTGALVAMTTDRSKS